MREEGPNPSATRISEGLECNRSARFARTSRAADHRLGHRFARRVVRRAGRGEQPAPGVSARLQSALARRAGGGAVIIFAHRIARRCFAAPLDFQPRRARDSSYNLSENPQPQINRAPPRDDCVRRGHRRARNRSRSCVADPSISCAMRSAGFWRALKCYEPPTIKIYICQINFALL